LHNKSFIDDPTRIFRAVRFESRPGFSIEAGTLRLMKAAIKMGMLAKLSISYPRLVLATSFKRKGVNKHRPASLELHIISAAVF